MMQSILVLDYDVMFFDFSSVPDYILWWSWRSLYFSFPLVPMDISAVDLTMPSNSSSGPVD